MKIIIGIIYDYLTMIKLLIDGFVSKAPKSWLKGDKNPIVVIPGVVETFWFFRKLIKYFNSKGYPVYVISPFDSFGTVTDLSQKVGAFIKEHNLNNVILLTHSKGGIIAKHLLTTDTDINLLVEKVISIATPFGGTKLGVLPLKNINELTPDHVLINNLQSSTEINAKFINLYPIVDNHIVPNSGSYLKGAVNIQIPVIGHTVILTSDKTLEVLERYF